MEPRETRIRLRRIRLVILVLLGIGLPVYIGWVCFGASGGSRMISSLKPMNPSELHTTIRGWGLGFVDWRIDTHISLIEPAQTETGSSATVQYDVVSIAAPYSFLVRDAETGAESIRVVPADDPRLYFAALKWSDDGSHLLWKPSARSSHQEGSDRVLIGTRYRAAGVLYHALMTAIIFAVIYAIAWLIVRIVTSPRIWIHLHDWQCPNCGYDLRGQNEPGCPECGWNRDGEGTEASRQQGITEETESP